MLLTAIALVGVLLAYANGANDNFKGVATLFGSGTTSYRSALLWASVTTFLGSLTAVFLAFSLWHLIASRNGYRAVVQPLIQLPVIWLLFKGWQRGSIKHFAAAGLFLGLTQYSYTAVRIFPVLIVAIVFMGLLVAPRIPVPEPFELMFVIGWKPHYI